MESAAGLRSYVSTIGALDAHDLEKERKVLSIQHSIDTLDTWRVGGWEPTVARFLLFAHD